MNPRIQRILAREPYSGRLTAREAFNAGLLSQAVFDEYSEAAKDVECNWALTLKQQLRAKLITHDHYYLLLAEAVGVWPSDDSDFFAECFMANKNGDDPHLNRVRLAVWDAKAASLGAYQYSAISEALKAFGDEGGVSQAQLVCILKAVYREACKRCAEGLEGPPWSAGGVV